MDVEVRNRRVKELEERYDYICRYIASVSPKLQVSKDMRKERTNIKLQLRKLGAMINKKKHPKLSLKRKIGPVGGGPQPDIKPENQKHRPCRFPGCDEYGELVQIDSRGFSKRKTRCAAHAKTKST